MTVIARKHSSVKQERLRRFVAEHLDALEPGLRIVEPGLRLGRMVVDLVAADARQTLVLIGVGTVATEKMLIGMLDAYIWCLQFPDGLRRLCPDAPIAFTRPPRLVIVAEQVPEAFMELVGCLSFEIECHELAGGPNRDADASATPAEPPAAEALVGAPPASDPGPATPAPTITTDGAARLAAGAATEVSGPSAVGVAPATPPLDQDAGPTAEPAAVEAEMTVAAAGTEDAGTKPAETSTADSSGGSPVQVPTTPTAPSPFSRNGRRIAAPERAGVELGSPTASGTPSAGERRESVGRPGRGYAFAQAVRQPHPAEKQPAPHGAPGGEPATAGGPTPTPEAVPAPERRPEGREAPPRPAVVDSLTFPSSGVSRQWQEFLARLASAQ